MKNVKPFALFLAALMTAGMISGCKGDTGNTSSSATGSADSAETSSVDDGEEVLSDLITADSSEAETDASANTSNKTSSKTSSKTSGKTETPTVSTTEDDAKATMPKITIPKNKVTVCVDWDPKSAWVQKWEEAFKKAYPGIDVGYKQATPAMKASKLAVWANSNQSPDIIYVKPEESWPDLVTKNLVDPVDSFIDINTAFWGSARSTMNSLKLNGKHYAMITTMDLYGRVIYNPTVMKNAGLTDPETLLYNNQWTWEKFEQYAKKLTKINTSDDSKSNYGIHFRYAETLLPTVGKDLIEYSNGSWKSNLNNNEIKTAIEFLRKMGPTGNKYALTSESEPTVVRKMVVSGQVGMYVTAEAAGLEFPDEFKKGTLKAVPIPRYTKSSTYYHGVSVDAFYVPKKASNPQGGVAFACAVRGMNIGLIKVEDTGEYTAAQKKIDEYAKSIISGVPLQFRRLQGTVEYYNIYGPTFLSGDSYSGVVAQWEPQVLEALKKQ